MFTDFQLPPLHHITTSGTHYQPLRKTDNNPIVSPVMSEEMSKADVAKVETLAKSAGLNRQVDWGRPLTADVPDLLISYRGRVQAIPSYGVGEQSLTKKQQASRAKVAKLLAWLSARTEGKEVKPMSLVIAAVEAKDVPKNGQKALRSDVALVAPVITVQDWPASGPKLSSTGSCLPIIDPAAVETLSKAAATVRFRSDAKVWQVYARIVLPGDRGCSV